MELSPETGAHLTDVVSRRSPSLFEILSQQNLASGLQSAFQHVTKILASEHPERLGWLYRKCDEIYLVFNAAIQYHYLRTRGGTLSETFYGIQRISLTTSSTSPTKRSLLVEVLLPYCEAKVRKIVEDWNSTRGTSDEPTAVANEFEISQAQREALLKLYYQLSGILTLVRFYYYILYILDKSKSHSLIFALFGWKLVYTNQDSTVDLGSNLKGWRHALFTLGEAVLPVIEFGSFFVQFLNWWNHERRRDFDIKPVPEPYEDDLNLDKVKCPICNQPRRNNTVLRTSGIVYCFGCISKYLSQIRKCPITGIPSNANDLVRIYS